MIDLKRNINLFYALEVFRALIFTNAVWVAFELNYLTFIQFTIIEGVIFTVQLLLELPTGAFADMFGRKNCVGLGYTACALGYLVFAFSTNFQMFLIYAIIVGIGESLISGAKEALVYDTLKELKQESIYTKINSKMGLIFQVVFAVATIIGGFMAGIYFRLPMLAFAFFLLVSGIVCFAMVEPHIDSEKFSLKAYIQKTKDGVRQLVKNEHIKKVSLFYILVGSISWACMLVFNNTLLTDLKYTAVELGITLAAIRLINSLALFRFLNVGKYFNRKRAYIFFPILMIISLLPGVFLTKWIAIPFIAGSMMASTARWVILGKYTNDEFDSGSRATAISALSMAIGILYIIFVFASGPVIEYFGDTRAMFTILGFISLIFVLPLGIDLAKNHSHDKVSGE
ncbi:MFS transporter, partial [Patescibacteria group bacterium]|nr:MFS transporter [Patescibacteria group bacterium]